VAKFGSGVINNSWVTSSILGKSDDIGKWVGCVGESSDTSNKLHIVKLETEKEKIYVRITLFAMLRGLVPEYLVVVGKAPTDQ